MRAVLAGGVTAVLVAATMLLGGVASASPVRTADCCVNVGHALHMRHVAHVEHEAYVASLYG